MYIFGLHVVVVVTEIVCCLSNRITSPYTRLGCPAARAALLLFYAVCISWCMYACEWMSVCVCVAPFHHYIEYKRRKLSTKTHVPPWFFVLSDTPRPWLSYPRCPIWRTDVTYAYRAMYRSVSEHRGSSYSACCGGPRCAAFCHRWRKACTCRRDGTRCPVPSCHDRRVWTGTARSWHPKS